MAQWARTVLIASLSALAACAGGERGGSGVDGGDRCDSDDDCNDSIDCTVDSCGVGGSCRFMPVDELCGDGETCSATRGCTTTADCSTDEECDDSIACTVDSCGVDMTCRHMALNELCESGETCDPSMGCVAGSGCTSDADCDDSIDCTLDSCGVDMTCRHMALDARCESGETCSETVGCYTPMPCETADDCQDGNFCNGAELCMPEFGCAPAAEPRMCNDSDPCTLDSCDTDADMCVFECDTSMAECGCGSVDVPCEGTFTISPTPMQTCACDLEGSCQVDYNVMTVTFNCVSDVLSVQAGVPSAALDAAMTQMPRASDGTFDVSHEVPRTCWERYRLTGRFTDADTFTATFSATYYSGGFCSWGGCANQSMMVTGTRI